MATRFSVVKNKKENHISFVYVFTVFIFSLWYRNKKWKLKSHSRAVFQFVSLQAATTPSATILPVLGGASAASQSRLPSGRSQSGQNPTRYAVQVRKRSSDVFEINWSRYDSFLNEFFVCEFENPIYGVESVLGNYSTNVVEVLVGWAPFITLGMKYLCLFSKNDCGLYQSLWNVFLVSDVAGYFLLQILT